MRTLAGLLEPGELAHLREVARWQGRPVKGVVVDEIRRQHGRYAIDGVHRVNRTKLVDHRKLDVEAGGPCPAEQFLQQEDVEQLYSFIAAMPPTRRDVVRLRLVGWGLAEIADQLGLTYTTVDYHLRRAKSYLRSRRYAIQVK